jgi:hypothetical protein
MTLARVPILNTSAIAVPVIALHSLPVDAVGAMWNRRIPPRVAGDVTINRIAGAIGGAAAPLCQAGHGAEP